jgi:ABC-type multidrug transport system fused ATPase/permease subunit
MLSALKHQYDELNPFGRFFFVLGLFSLFVAAAMTFKFGWSMSVLHALGLGVLSIVASFLPEAAYRMKEEGHAGLAVVLALLATPLLAVEYFSHVGYTVGQRVGNVQQTGVHNTKFEDTRASLEADRESVSLWKKQLADLTAQAPWAPTIKAEALRGELDAMAKAVELEEQRGGCKRKCQALMVKKAEVEKKIGTVEQAEDLARRIEATQRIIDGKTEKAATATFESSPVVNQTAFVAKMIAWDLKPGEGVQEGSTIGISAMLALANVLLTPLCFLIAGRSRRYKSMSRAMTETRRDVEDVYETLKLKAHDTAGNVNATFITAKDDLSRELAELIARMGKELKAA